MPVARHSLNFTAIAFHLQEQVARLAGPREMVSDMFSFLRSSVAAVALVGLGLVSPAMAQSASEMAVRIQQLEEQVRLLMGQVEQLDYEVKQLRAQGGRVKTGALEPRQVPAMPATKSSLSAAAPADNGIEQIETQPMGQMAPADVLAGGQAPGPTVLGALNNAAARPGDGGFEGKVLVAPGQQEPGDDAFLVQDMTQGSMGGGPDEIETVSLLPDAGESPEDLYKRSNESLLRRKFAEAEAGFRDFLTKYPDHGLAGTAQFWLGETYYAQDDYRQAAQAFLQGYKKYPKGRRAADSLLKLGISLGRLGQTQQACLAFASVSSEYPKAVEARKRAQAEAKRAGCAA